MDSDERVPNGQYEFELGWNTSSPRFQFPDSDKAEVDSGANGRDPCSPLGENPPPPLKIQSSVQESLGKYTTLLPGSSPPRPPFKMRKRHPQLRRPRNIKKTKVGTEDSPSESNSLAETPGSPLSDIEIVEVSVRKSPSKNIESVGSIEDELSKATLLDAEINQHNKLVTSLTSNTSELNPKSEAKPLRKAPVKSLSDAELASFHNIDDIEDLGVDEIEEPVTYQPSFFSNRKTRRFVVQDVSELLDRTLLSCLNAQNEEQTVELRGSWRESVVKRGDTIHLVSAKPSSLMTVDSDASQDNQLLLVINPDVLIPCTTVSMAMSCERQVVLNTQVRAPSDLNENLVLGSIKHEFIQSCFTYNSGGDFTKTVMTEGLKRACENNALDLRLVDSDVESAFAKLEKIIPDIQGWASKIWGKSSSGVMLDSIRLRIDRAIQIEEEIRSPYMGLVGKIDVTCDVTHFGEKSVTRLAGLEIKTGKFTQSIGHRAQTALYTLLMAERHPNNTHPWSLLYYTETGSTSVVTLKLSEIAALIQRRNKVAHDMWSLPGRELPLPVSATDMACKWCNRKNSCVLYTEIDDNGNTHGLSALQAVYERIKETGSLKPNFLSFVKHWHTLLDLEYDMDNKQNYLKQRQWWVTDPGPVLWKLDQKLNGEDARSCDKHYSLVPINDSCPPKFPDLTGRSVLLSTKQQMALNFGFVTGSSGNNIALILRDELPTFGKYRIDTDPYLTDVNLGLARFNLNSLIDNDRLRELIVDMVPPKWHLFSREMISMTIERASNRVLHTQSGSSSVIEQSGDSSKSVISPQTHSNLNSDQASALNKVLNARDYALILGMPGTGKTTTIAAIVASLVERGKTVLVSAYTNSAVDTIVQKLLDAQQKCLRLVSSNYDTALMSADVAAVSVSMSANADNSRLLDFLSAPVVACTSHGTNNKIFSLRQFDYCILDEASQITLPFVLGPIRLAPVFVLVGDHYQLPPLVRNQQARKMGMDQSLFKILSETHPEAVVALTKQYRMCQDIMSLSSELVYDGKLVAGNDAVAHQKLHIKGWSFINPKSPIYVPLNPDNRVVFLNTDGIGEQAREKKHDDGSSNPGEAKIVCNIVRMLADLGVAVTDCAVISVYRHQLASLSALLNREVDKGLEILTADQAQGRDKNCIIVSLVKSNEHASPGELLKDWRRLNVAFTRAKQKLIIIGSKRTMQQADGVARFFSYIESRGWVHPAVLSM